MLLPLKKEALSFFAGLLLPGVGTYDHRVPLDPEQQPWRAIGRVQTELGTRCTGFLIAPRLVVTAAHCLYLRRPGNFIQPSSVHFVTGYALGRFDGHARVTEFRIAPDYDPKDEAATAGADWALLTLDASLGAPDRALSLADRLPADGTPVALAGYGRDREEVMDGDLSCLVTNRAEDRQHRPLLQHSCDATFGTSGAPLLGRALDGHWEVLGVQVAALGGAGGFAAPLDTAVLATLTKPRSSPSP